MTFEISSAQIDGARDYQEDAFLITHLGDSDSEGGSLVIVADGMGGHAAGNVASNTAVQAFNKHITSNFSSETFSDVLRESVVQPNSSISETVHETAALKGMGCTLVAAVMENKFIRWVSVGDSHLYLIRKNELNKKNADHSYGGFLDRMAAEGAPIEPEAGFSSNMLMSALTGQGIAEIDRPETPLELEAGDRLIVASDGLDSLSQGKILSFSNDATNPKDCVDALLEGVEEVKMPRQDNTTVIIIDVAEKEDAPTATPELAPVEPAPLAESAPAAPFVVDDEPEKSNTGMIIAIVALVLGLGVGGAYWFTNQSSSPSTDTYVSEDEPFEDEIDSEYEITDDDIEVEPDPEVIVEAPVEPAPEAKPVPPTEIKVGEKFSDSLKAGGSAPEMIWVSGGRMQMGGRESARTLANAHNTLSPLWNSPLAFMK